MKAKANIKRKIPHRTHVSQDRQVNKVVRNALPAPVAAPASAPVFSGPYVRGPQTILTAAGAGIADRVQQRDLPSGERSMRRTVDAFNAITGNLITEHDGWLFMAMLKAARAAIGGYVAEDYQDGAAYFALAGECASRAAMDAALANVNKAAGEGSTHAD
ncbi:MAG: hypothetical protein IJI03_12470 [Rudaea sp.]|nr:hypothetical protein [Rudaea sp.]